MKLKTLSCNLTTFKKDLTRFAPLWALYLIGMVLVLLETGGQSYDEFAANALDGLIAGFAVVNLVYAALCANILFGDLYNTRMCYSLHTVPMRREGLFLSHWCAALVFSLVPNVIASLLLMIYLKSYAFLALWWLLAVTLQFIFFFGIGALAAMLTGNRLAMLLVYASINFISMLVYWVVSSIFLPMMNGVVMSSDAFFLLCPVVCLCREFGFFAFDCIVVGEYEYYTEYFYEYVGLDSGWGYMAILAGVGIVASAIAVVLYRLRHLESAGDFVSFPRLKGAACVVMTLCAAAVFALVGEEMVGGAMYPWMAVGVVIGFFGSMMLLERRVKVFRPKVFAGFGVISAVLILAFMAVGMDWFGIVNWTPNADRVSSIIISNYRPNNGALYTPEEIYGNRLQSEVTDPEDIEEVIRAHKLILQEQKLGDAKDGDEYRITVQYTLDNGRKVIRTYAALVSGTHYDTFRRLLYTPQSILGYTDWEDFAGRVVYIAKDGHDLPHSCYQRLLEALRADCENGHITVGYQYTDKSENFYITLQIRQNNGSYNYREICVGKEAQNTRAILLEPEVIMGYTDWQEYLQRDRQIEFLGNMLEEYWHESLLEALRKDIATGAVQLGYRSEDTLMEFFVYDQYGSLYFFVDKYATNTLQWYDNYLNAGKEP